jgi:hypothetical protein
MSGLLPEGACSGAHRVDASDLHSGEITLVGALRKRVVVVERVMRLNRAGYTGPSLTLATIGAFFIATCAPYGRSTREKARASPPRAFRARGWKLEAANTLARAQRASATEG